MLNDKLVQAYQTYRTKLRAYRFAEYLISWDSETEAPVGCFDVRSQMVGVLSSESFKLMTCKDTVDMINELYANLNELDELLQIEIKHAKKSLDKLTKIPEDEYVSYMELLSKSSLVWANAKKNNDFASFEPILTKIVEFNQKMMKYLETDTLKGYDTLLDEYEEGATQVVYDEFFDTLKKELVPFAKKVCSTKINYHPLKETTYPKEKQELLTKYFVNELGLDPNYTVVKTSEHPFTSGFGSTDVRITTHYYEDNLLSNIYSVIHEGGHAIYELQCGSHLEETLLGGGSTMAMHESQSRFFENIIGRSYHFIEKHYPKIKSLFEEELDGITMEDFYFNCNEAKMSFIRIEADELTYPIHIMIRYDIEKELMSGKLQVKDLPARWNELVKDYLGLDVPSDTVGVLQDVHWSGGSFGYFPTYAYGSAIAAQLYYAMKKEFDVTEDIKHNSLKKVKEYLKENVHQYGQTKLPQEMLLKATGEKFNPKYYIEYLKEKYTKLYNL